MARLGIDLSGDSIALAEVRPAGTRLHLRGYALLAPVADRSALAEVLRRARDHHRFPVNAEVVAWAGEPRVSAVRAAGYTVERVILPGAALARVARWHHGLASPPSGEVMALVSLDETSGAMAVVRDATVLYEAPLSWSSNAAPGSADVTGTELLRRFAFLAEVTELFHAAFASVQRSHGASVSRILICGSLPDLRSLTAPLSEEFDVPVGTLDAPQRIDVRRVRGRSRDEAETALAALQIAMVASRRWHQARSPMSRVLRIAVPIGVAAGIGIYVAGPSESPVPSPPTGSQREPRGTSGSRVGASPSTPAARPASRADAPASSPRVGAEPTTGRAPEDASRHRAGVAPPARRRTTGANSTTEPAPISLSLSSILWSAQRQLVIVEGQVLGVGDTIAGMKIVEIQPDAVILRDRAGRLRRAELRRPRPTGSDSPPPSPERNSLS